MNELEDVGLYGCIFDILRVRTNPEIKIAGEGGG